MIDKKNLDPITRKLYEGFIQAHFRWLHFEKARREFRRAFLDAMRKKKINESVKIVDFEMNLLTHLKWYDTNPDRWNYDPEYPGEYTTITPVPYNCIQTGTVLKCNRRITRNPLKVLESDKNGK